MGTLKTRNVLYGTSLQTFIAKNVFAQFPNPNFRAVKPSDERPHPFDGISPFVSLALLKERMTKEFLLDEVSREDAKRESAVTRGFPSVSLLNGCVPESLQPLYWWQYKQMKTMGEVEFRKFVRRNLTNGIMFHSTIHRLLTGLKENGKIAKVDDDFWRQCGGVRSYIESILHFLQTLKPNSLMCMEERTYSPELCYAGKFDAIIELDDELVLVDWKTINTYSEKSLVDEKCTLKGLYSYPAQVAAYIAAVNACKLYENYPTIRRGAIVLAYEDGRPAECIMMGEEDIMSYFQIHLKNVNYFWYTMENQTPNLLQQISFVYNPHLSQQVNGEC